MGSSLTMRTGAAWGPADILARLGRAVDRAVDGVCVLSLVVMVAVTLLQVFCRYVLNASLLWPEEVARWLFVWMVFLGMAIAVRRNAHIRIDMFLEMMPPRARGAFEFLTHALTVTACLAIAIQGWETANHNASQVASALELSFKYEYMAVPAGALMALYYLVHQSATRWRPRIVGVAGFGLGVLLYWVLQEQGGGLSGVSDPTTVLLVSALVLLTMGMPVGFALVLSTFLAFWPRGPLLVQTVTQNMVGMTDSFVLLAVPFFILAGGLMNEGGITLVLVRLADALVGHIRGGLGHVNVVTNTLMAGLSGSSAADAAGVAKVLVPAMRTQGYDPAFAAALTSAASTLANVIPPSIAMLMYAALASTSVGALFLAGIIPGLVMTASLMLVVYFESRRHGYGASRKRTPVRQVMASLRRSSWALGLPFVIVLGIRFGVFTPTEAAGVAVLYTLLVGLAVYRGLSLRSIPSLLSQSVLETTGAVFIIAASSPFAWLLVVEQLPQMLASQFSGLVANPALLMLALNGFLLLVGMPLENAPAMAILVPILVPIVTQAGIDPVYFGIVMIINLMLGSLTPPIGMLAFITATVTKVPAHRVFWAVVPFELALVAALLIVTYIPAISLWLPRVIGGH